MEISNNVCVIGAGYWGKNHIRTLNSLNKLGAIVESNIDVLDRFSQEYPNAKMYPSLDEALLNKNLEGFTVATPAETHFEIARNIIKAKKHVLVEKPLTLDIAHAQELVRLAEKNQVNLMVGHVLLFHPAIIKIKKLIKEGFANQIYTTCNTTVNPSTKMGGILSNASHSGKLRRVLNCVVIFKDYTPYSLNQLLLSWSS